MLRLLFLGFARAQLYRLPSSTPKQALSVTSDFIGYHFQVATWAQFALDASNHTNQFTANLFAAITNRTGGSPQIRLGGSDFDYASYQPGLVEPVTPTISRELIGPRFVGTQIGPSYWQLCTNFDTLGTQFVIQLPVASTRTNQSELVVWAQTSRDALGSRIRAWEMGNEPNEWGFGYPQFMGRVDDQSYVDVFLNSTAAVSTALSLGDGQRVFQALDTAMQFPPSANAHALPVPTEFQLGLDKNQQIGQIGEHLYATASATPEDLGSTLLNHAFTTNLFDVYIPWIHFLSTQSSGSIPLVFSEYGVSLGGQGPGFANTMGSALWHIDAALYCMSIGVGRIYHTNVLPGFDMLWLPQESDGVPAQVFTVFYALPFIADFIGLGNATKVSVLEASDKVNTTSIVAYAAYENDAPQRAALLNLDLWGGYVNNSTAQTPGKDNVPLTIQLISGITGSQPRPSATFSIVVPPSVTGARVQYLSNSLGAYDTSTDDLTYDGLQWTAASQGLPVTGPRNDTLLIETDMGYIDVQVDASAAALVYFLS